ncbi:MAG: hypothetical protein ACLFTA_02650 [Candidatus Nanohaloarchaea archaeon]
MENLYLVIGVLLLFSGIVGYGYTASEMEECGSILGELDQSLDEDSQQYCNNIGLANSASIGAAAVGLILSAVGLVSLARLREN